MTHNAIAGDLQTLLLSDQLPAEIGSGAGKHTFENPILSDNGDVSYFVTFDPDESNDIVESIWKHSGNTNQLIAKTGGAANVPGAELTFRVLTVPEVNQSGEMAFYGNVTTVFTSEGRRYGGPGLWKVHSDGALETIAVRSTPSPEPGWTFQTVGDSYYSNFYQDPWSNDLRISNSGEILFSSIMVNPPTFDEREETLWSTANELHLVYSYEAGAPIAGLDPEVKFSEPLNSAIDEYGRSLLFVGLNGPGIDGSNSLSILAEQNGQFSLLWQYGNPSPGITKPIQIVGAQYASMNNAGQIQTYAYINETEHGLVLLDPGGQSHIITANGMPAPGTPWEDAVFGTFGTYSESFLDVIELNNAGDSAFLEVAESPSTGEEAYGLWVEGNGEFRMVAMGGMAAPGIPDAIFSPIPGSVGSTGEGGIVAAHRAPWFADKITLNDTGQLAFLATYDYPDTLPHSAAGAGIWAEDAEKNLTLIAHTGGTITVGPGDFREIRSLDLLGQDFSSSRERNSSFNSLGQIAFRATFTDGSSGIFLSNAVAIPEPSSLLLLVMGFANIAISRRRASGLTTD